MLDDDGRRQLTREAAGSPFVLEQLARYAGVRVPRPGRPPTFADMFAARLGSLSPEAHRLLETLAICGRPMASDVVCDASGSRANGSPSLQRSALRVSFAAAARRGGSRPITTAFARCSPRPSLLTRRNPRPHGGGAGRAGQRRLRGAVRALSRRRRHGARRFRPGVPATSRAPRSPSTGRRLSTSTRWRWAPRRVPRARGGKDLPPRSRTPAVRPRPPRPTCGAAGADDLQRVELQRRGAEQFLIGGHIDRGRDLIRTMLADLGMSVPRSPRAALLPLLWRRARLRWRGLHFTSRAAGQIDADTSCAWTPAGPRRRDCCSWT